MTASLSCVGFFLLFAWLCPSEALYFHIGETEKKCFIEEIPDETMVIGGAPEAFSSCSGGKGPHRPQFLHLLQMVNPNCLDQKMRLGLSLWQCGENILDALPILQVLPHTTNGGKYRTQLWDKTTSSFLPATPGLGMHVEIKDPDTKVILSRQYGSDGRFTFTSHTPGEHQICLHSNSTKMALFAGGKLRVHLDIQVGEHTNNYPEIAAKDKLTELQLRVRQLLDQVEQIQKEQNYQRYREERFRMTSESTNQRVLWWSIAQTVILIITAIWQMRHLKSFFEAKKLV